MLTSYCVLLATGCVTAEPREELPFQETEAFSSSQGAPLAEFWWRELADDELSRTIEHALERNFSLVAAYERIAEARAIAGIESSAQSPKLDATLGGTLRDGQMIDPQSELALGLEADYEIDLWGKISSSVAAQELEAQATAEDYQAAAITISADLALAWYRRAEALLQLDLLDSQLKTNSDVLSVLEDRFEIGQSSSADVLRQRRLVESTIEQQILTRASLDALEHQLLAMSALPAQSAADFPAIDSLPQIAAPPAIGLPIELLQRRPDIRAAYYRIESADASVAAAVKDQYPSLSIGAALSSAAENPSGVFDSWIASLSAQLVAPLLDGKMREHEIEREVAIRRRRIAEYADAVLDSFRDVEDALSFERSQILRIENLQRQLELAQDTYSQLRLEHINGVTDFIDVLEALRDQQGLERSLLSARLLRIEYRIALYRAIAGGFMDDSYTAVDAEALNDETAGMENRSE
jgi:NodT family efflux transporter outer membrane factor (OMF) lipoprotein